MLIQKSKLATMGEMIETIAHQWRQPLNSIIVIAEDTRDSYEYGEFDGEYLKDSIKKNSNLTLRQRETREQGLSNKC